MTHSPAVKQCFGEDTSQDATTTAPTKKPKRPRGQGSGYFIITHANQGKYGKKYPQTSYQVEFGKRKRSVYIPAEKVEEIRRLHTLCCPILEILSVIDSPKSRCVAEEYRNYLENKKSKLSFC
ncbi:MAG: hypothetical protein N5P05_003053 [Chroococcopsis gigantea SAG 12.99]|jgi:hypothetical protein|nr:hypothetical protein [Chlorogloea purpurea SAG 13.99]MDV3001447.1 hypothetical protein [Chroococcopsis gigantea SAG 12.99]